MAFFINKGQEFDLSKSSDVCSKLVIGLGWDVPIYDSGVDFDLDLSAFMLGFDNKIIRQKDLVFYNNQDSSCGSIHHTGDNRTGNKDEPQDDELIIIDPIKIPLDVKKIAITVSIHDAKIKKQIFGIVSNSYVKVSEFDSQKELLRYDLEEDFSIATSIIVCEIFNDKGVWKFGAIGNGVVGELESLALIYGLNKNNVNEDFFKKI